jgi:maltooligosyltrehalose trehalohydrolase
MSTAGAVVEPGGGVRFRVWAPGSRQVEVVLEEGGAVALQPEPDGWFSGVASAASAGSRYRLRLDGDAVVPDPWSRHQPDGVHGASAVWDPASFRWTDAGWQGVAPEELVIHEVHVGTATEPGTFDALAERLPYFVELGVTALELMPVAAFPGARNWGYDGVFLFAPEETYGGPAGLQRFVDAAHGHGLAVILDVVYNHFGPEGNYMPAVTADRIFTEKHHTPWGAAINYDDRGSAAVRLTVLENVRQWIRDYHIDGLRLDAAHAIEDGSARHILQEIGEAARSAAPDRRVVVIAEDERNERRLLLPTSQNGHELDGVWADDFHHVLRRLTAGDTDGYYAAYEGTTQELAETLRRGWLYEGAHYAPTDERRGTPADGLPPTHFVHCIQNHDQVGNRALGERLHHEIEPALYRAVSALLLLTPYTPLLWMGQEWAASTPFQYFTDHPEELGRLVTQGRRDEFGKFEKFSDPALREQIPDPQAESTFARSRLQWAEAERPPHSGVLALYRELLALRRTHAALQARGRDSWRVAALSDTAIALRRSAAAGAAGADGADGADGAAGADGGDASGVSGAAGAALLLVVNVRGSLELDVAADAVTRPPAGGDWRLRLDTEAARFGGADTARLADGVLTLPAPGAALLEA